MLSLSISCQYSPCFLFLSDVSILHAFSFYQLPIFSMLSLFIRCQYSPCFLFLSAANIPHAFSFNPLSLSLSLFFRLSFSASCNYFHPFLFTNSYRLSSSSLFQLLARVDPISFFCPFSISPKGKHS